MDNTSNIHKSSDGSQQFSAEVSSSHQDNKKIKLFEDNIKAVLSCTDRSKKAELIQTTCLNYLQKDDNEIYNAETDDDDDDDSKPVKTLCFTPDEQEHVAAVMNEAPKNMKYFIDDCYELSIIPNKRFIMLQNLSNEFIRCLNTNEAFPNFLLPFIHILNCVLKCTNDKMLNKLNECRHFVTAVDKIKRRTCKINYDQLDKIIKSEKMKVIECEKMSSNLPNNNSLKRKHNVITD